jgi:hypothetical protein
MNDNATRSVSIADAALLAGGVWLLGLGLYFIVLRPPLLAEDERFIGTSLQSVSAALLGVLPWLGHVFDVLGGFAAGLGALILCVVIGRATRAIRLGAGVIGLAVCVWMAATNFALKSDFRWLLSLAVLPWLVAVAALLLDRRNVSKGLAR